MFGVAGHTHTEPVPWLSYTFGRWVTVDIVAKAAVPVIFATVGIMIYGGWKEQKEAAKHGHDEGGGFMGIVIEVILVRIVEMLSNIISYSQIRDYAASTFCPPSDCEPIVSTWRRACSTNRWEHWNYVN